MQIKASNKYKLSNIILIFSTFLMFMLIKLILWYNLKNYIQNIILTKFVEVKHFVKLPRDV